MVQKGYKNGTKSTEIEQLEILRNPATVKGLAIEIIKACDYYISLKLSEKELRSLIWHYAQNHGNKFFSLQNLNPTLQNRIGKRRAELVEEMLKGIQLKLI